MKIGDFSKLNVGTTGITRAFLGADLVWPTTGKYAKAISSVSELNETDTYILVSEDKYGSINEPYRYIASNKYFSDWAAGTDWYSTTAITYGDAIYVPDDAIRIKIIERSRGDESLTAYVKVDGDIIARDTSTWATTIVSNPYLLARNSGTVSNVDTDIFYRDTLEDVVYDTFRFYNSGSENDVLLQVIRRSPTSLTSLALCVSTINDRIEFGGNSAMILYKIIK